MQKTWAICALAVGLAGAGNARAQVDLSELDRDMQGPPAQVLVLGTVHLNTLPKDFPHQALEPLIDRLVAFKPEVVTIEAISGEQCDTVARHPAIYGKDGFAPYCGSTEAAQAATGLDRPAAIAAVRKTLADWSDTPTPAQRRQLAAWFMAAGETPSALVQWLQLPPSERHAGDGLDDALALRLDKSATGNDESSLIAARVAARLGLQRLHAVDDHTGDNVDVADEAAFGQAIQRAWDTGAAAMKPVEARRAELIAAGDLLGLYRYINRPESLRTVVESDFGAALRDASPQRYGRIYVAGWETRNLRMVGNVRAAFRERPGARVLSIVGLSHKPWFDSLLGQMQGVTVVDAEQVLK